MRLSPLIPAVIVLALSACGGSDPTEPKTPIPTSITVSPDAMLLAVGGAGQLTATVFDQTGTQMAVPVSWSATPEAIASVSTAGLVTASGEGIASVTATAGSATRTTTITVVPGLNLGITVDVTEAGYDASSEQYECHHTINVEARDGVPGDAAEWSSGEVQWTPLDGSPGEISFLGQLDLSDYFGGATVLRGTTVSASRTVQRPVKFDLDYTFRYTFSGEARSRSVAVDCFN
jgi:hypothetical protein